MITAELFKLIEINFMIVTVIFDTGKQTNQGSLTWWMESSF